MDKPKRIKLYGEDLRKLQLILLDILIELDRVCRKHNIKYYICSGTLLGAVRHKGFIPTWAAGKRCTTKNYCQMDASIFQLTM